MQIARDPTPADKTLRQEVKEQAIIKMWLDSYDDLFSDFDPRPYSRRAVSDDFIGQAKKVARDHLGNIDSLLLLLPESVRKQEHETAISRRLHSFFIHSCELIKADMKRIQKRAFSFLLAGVFFMLLAGYISYLEPPQFYVHIILVLFEPAGWFLFWTGLDHLFSDSGKTKKELNFFKQMSAAGIKFGAY